MPTKPGELPFERRKKIFAALVSAQDQGANPVRARLQVSRVYHVSVLDVQRSEEEEGLKEEWPPLGT